eukprot:scaffold2682_cov344-Pavlova_lutheri.AAC.11
MKCTHEPDARTTRVLARMVCWHTYGRTFVSIPWRAPDGHPLIRTTAESAHRTGSLRPAWA